MKIKASKKGDKTDQVTLDDVKKFVRHLHRAAKRVQKRADISLQLKKVKKPEKKEDDP